MTHVHIVRRMLAENEARLELKGVSVNKCLI